MEIFKTEPTIFYKRHFQTAIREHIGVKILVYISTLLRRECWRTIGTIIPYITHYNVPQPLRSFQHASEKVSLKSGKDSNILHSNITT